MPTAAPQREPRHPGGLGGELQSARGGQAQLSADLANHGGQSGMAQAFFHGEQNCIQAAGFGIHHTLGGQTHPGESGGEQVGSLQHPEHVAAQPSEPAGDEQCGRGAVLRLWATAGNLVQRTTRQAASRKVAVDCRDAECCRRSLTPGRSLLQPRNASAKCCKLVVLDAGVGDRGHPEHIKNTTAPAKSPLVHLAQCLTKAILLWSTWTSAQHPVSAVPWSC